MPKFNIYKIENTQKANLIEKITSVGLVHTSNKEIGNYNFDFYLSVTPDEIPIWWVDYYKDFIDQEEDVTNKVNFALLLIHDDQKCYAISLGKTHFYIKPYCDSDFGINMAERIINVNDLRLKNSKFYKTKKSKTVTSYLSNTELDYDSGESLHYLRAKTIDSTLWGNIASFGQSMLLTLDINTNQLAQLITLIEQTLHQPAITNIPKAEKITDPEEIANLDALLVQSILDEDDSSVDYQNIVLSGVDFIFSENNQYQYILKGTDIIGEIINDLSIQTLRDFVAENTIDLTQNISNINIRIIREEGRNSSKSLKMVLEYMTEDRECLIDGAWHKFNQSYIDLLKDYVRQIKINEHDQNFDIDINNQITETEFNEKLENNGYLNLHTSNHYIGGFTIETTDLLKDNTLYFVKKGTPQKLNYVIDQALNTLNVLKNNIYLIQDNNGVDIEVKKICLWLIIKRVNTIETLDEIQSIIFLMKLMHLSKEIQDNRLDKLEININYIR